MCYYMKMEEKNFKDDFSEQSTVSIDDRLGRVAELSRNMAEKTKSGTVAMDGVARHIPSPATYLLKRLAIGVAVGAVIAVILPLLFPGLANPLSGEFLLGVSATTATILKWFGCVVLIIMVGLAVVFRRRALRASRHDADIRRERMIASWNALAETAAGTQALRRDPKADIGRSTNAY